MAKENSHTVEPLIKPEVVPPVVRFAVAEKFIEMCRSLSIWPMAFGLACCSLEMMAAGMSRFDLARFGSEVFRPSPRQADLMIVPGAISKKMAPAIVRLYEQMPHPKWVIAFGSCAISGGPFVFKEQYGIIEGIDKLIPVDVYVPGCPPRPEALFEAIFKLQELIGGKRWWPHPPKEAK